MAICMHHIILVEAMHVDSSDIHSLHCRRSWSGDHHLSILLSIMHVHGQEVRDPLISSITDLPSIFILEPPGLFRLIDQMDDVWMGCLSVIPKQSRRVH